MFSKSCKYALRTVVLLSVNQNSDVKLGAKAISDQLDIPQPFLAKILQELSKKKIISSAKGVKGGFFLSEANTNGSLLKVVEVIDGLDAFDECVLGLSECGKDNPCPVHAATIQYRENLKKLFEQTKIGEISDLIDQDKMRF